MHLTWSINRTPAASHAAVVTGLEGVLHVTHVLASRLS